MVIVPYCLVYPGTWLDLSDHDAAREIASLLSLMESSLTDAAISLGAYIDSQNIPRHSADDHIARQEAANQRRIHEQLLKAEWGIGDLDFSRDDEIRTEVHRRRLNEAFTAGRIPNIYIHRMPFVHAMSFLVTAHTIRVALTQCAKFNYITVQADAAGSAIDAALPKLKGVRDSTAHVDERVQGMARKKKIQLQPIQNNFINSPQGGVLVIGSLNGDNFGNTMDDGNYGEVAVTRDTFNLFVKVIQEFVDKLPWRGWRRVVPHL
jgi:hypothetical protein